MDKVIVISKGAEMLLIPADRLVCIKAEGNYSHLGTQDNRVTRVPFQLGQIEDLINNQLGEKENRFIRLGRSLIINQDYVYHIDPASQTIVLSDCRGCYHLQTASRDVLATYKSYLEIKTNNGRRNNK